VLSHGVEWVGSLLEAILWDGVLAQDVGTRNKRTGRS